MNRLAPYAKFVTALLATNATWLSSAWVPDGTISRVEWYGLIVANLGALGVFGVPNALTRTQVAAATVAAQTDSNTLEHPASAANTTPDGWPGAADDPDPQGA